MKKILFCISLPLAVFYVYLLIKNIDFVAGNHLEYNYGVIAGRIVLLVIFSLVAYYTNKDFWRRLFSPIK